jgi:hypothetical protein
MVSQKILSWAMILLATASLLGTVKYSWGLFNLYSGGGNVYELNGERVLCNHGDVDYNAPYNNNPANLPSPYGAGEYPSQYACVFGARSTGGDSYGNWYWDGKAVCDGFVSYANSADVYWNFNCEQSSFTAEQPLWEKYWMPISIGSFLLLAVGLYLVANKK